MKLSLARRLALMFAAAGLAVFVAGGLLLHRSLDKALDAQQEESLELRLLFLEKTVASVAQAEEWAYVVGKLDALTPDDGSLRFWIHSDDPHFRYGTLLPAHTPLLGGSDGFGRLPMEGLDCDMKALLRSIPANGERPAVQLVMALDTDPYLATLGRFTGTLVIISATGVLLVGALGYWIARLGLRPLRRLSDEANGLSPTKLSQRLRTERLPAELSALVGAFNGALSRLETAYKKLETFNADVAHEIRTPLANLIGQTQVALTRRRSVAELEEVLHSNLEELDRMRGIVNDMLFLARADQGVVAHDRIPSRLSLEVEKTAEFLEPLLDEAETRVRIAGDASLRIETALFRRAMTNLLRNAAQHALPGSEILVEIGEEPGGGARVAVTNAGPTIAAQHLEHIFDRFYRVDTARTNSGDSHGLGLSIVKAVAAMHLGQVFASSRAGSTTIGFTLANGNGEGAPPAAAPTPAPSAPLPA